MDGPGWSGTLRHNVCRDVPQILYEIGNLTTALEKWGFDGRRSNARWFWRWAGGAVRGLRCKDVLAWKRVWRGKTWRVFFRLGATYRTRRQFTKFWKENQCLLSFFFIFFCPFHNTCRHVSKPTTYFSLQLDHLKKVDILYPLPDNSSNSGIHWWSTWDHLVTAWWPIYDLLVTIWCPLRKILEACNDYLATTCSPLCDFMGMTLS